MNVALFASAFHPSLGGVEELVRQLAHELSARQDTTAVFTERWPRSLAPYEKYEGIDVFRLPMRVPDGGWKVQLNYRLTHGAIRREMLRLLQDRGTDLLHVQCVSSNAYYALRAKRLLGLPLVVTLQGELTMDAGGLFQRSAFARDLMRTALTEADRITACSEQTLREAEQFLGTPFGDRASVIYNGIRLQDFKDVTPYAHPRPYIFALGRHVPQKGFDILLEAFVRAENKSHDLLIAGDGVERQALERLAADLGLGDRVRFIGRVDRAEAVRLFTGCSFFVLPSRHEPMGIVNLEAMAAGAAVLATCVGGVPEIVTDGETGLLVPGENADAMAEAITRLATDAALRTSLGKSGRARAEKQFDWSVIAGQYQAIYQSAALPKPTLTPTVALNGTN